MIINSPLLKRALTAILGVLILLTATFIGNILPLYTLACLFLLILSYETGMLVFKNKKYFIFLLPLHLTWYTSLFFIKDIHFLFLFTAFELSIWLWVSSYLTKKTEDFYKNHTQIYPFLFFSLICPSFTLGHLLQTNGVQALYGLLITVFIFDTASYFSGKTLGLKFFSKNLFPKASPKKTKEGALIGALITVSSVFYLSTVFPHLFIQFSKIEGSILKVVSLLGITFLALSGDLLESTLKRISGVKDSGALLPGHGGAFDRLDGVLLASILSYMLLQF